MLYIVIFDWLYTLSTLSPHKNSPISLRVDIDAADALGPHTKALAKECGSKAFGQGGTEFGSESSKLGHGYGSIPIHTIFRGMNIHKSQLF